MKRDTVFRKLFCILFCLQYMLAGAQNDPQELDSLLKVLKSANDPIVKADVHSRVAWLNIIKDIDYAKAHLDTSLTLFEGSDNKRGMANVKYRFAVLHRFTGEYAKALEYADQYLEYSKSTDDTLALANIYYQKGVIFSQSGDYEQSLEEYFNCLRIYEGINDTSSRAFTMNSIGIVYKNLNKYEEAERTFIEAIRLLEPINDKNNLADVYHSLGNLYAIQKQFDKALDYFNKTLQIGIELDRIWGIAKDYSSMGLVHLEKNDYDLAIDFLRKAQSIYEENKYEEDLTETLLNLGKAHIRKGDMAAGESYLLRALGRPIESLRIEKELHHELYEVYTYQNLPSKALYHHENYVTANDSLYQEENIRSINNLQLKYDTEKKDNELVQNKLLLEQKEVQILKNKNLLHLTIGAALLLLLFGLGFWYSLRQRELVKNIELETLKSQRAVTKLESLIEGEEKERKRLAQDLHDGINGDLSVIKYKLTDIDFENQAEEELGGFKEAIKMLDNAIEQVRNISHNLAPPSLQNFSLTEALFQFCQNMASSSSIEIKFQSFGTPIKLGSDYETAIYRMVQELINNIVKHAEATEALVQLNHHINSLDITIEDNGKGYDTAAGQEGIGLKNIQSRAAFLHSDLQVDSSDEGTSVHIQIDLNTLYDD